jgi:outer membrane protein
MTVKSLLTLGALSSLALASAAWAQAPAAPAVSGAVGGPPVAGACTYLSDGALYNSAVGKSTAERLKQLLAAVQAELTPEANDLQTEQHALQAMTQEQRQASVQRIQAFQAKAQDFERKQELRAKELEATNNKQFGIIRSRIQPILNQVATERGCGMLFERAQLYWANPSMDITETVVQRLNGQLTALPAFDREHLDQQTAAAPPPAATAATTTHKKSSK